MDMELGLLRQAFGLDLMRSLQKVLESHQDKDVYYILVTAVVTGYGVKTTIIVLPRLTKYLDHAPNTLCWKVDNKVGKVEMLWALPRYDPVSLLFVDDDVVKDVGESLMASPTTKSLITRE